MAGVHDTVGQDLVNHCVNDILVQGASPLFFLDYIAHGALDADVVAQRRRGPGARPAARNGCALLGGETAEMPGVYPTGEYDLVGFIVGAVGARTLHRRLGIRAGDALLGAALRRPAHQRLLAGARDCLRGARPAATRIAGTRRARWRTRCWRVHRSPTCRRSARCSRRGLVTGAGAHHRRRHHGQPAARSAAGDRRPHRQVCLDAQRRVPVSPARRRRSRGRHVPRVQHGRGPDYRVRG